MSCGQIDLDDVARHYSIPEESHYYASAPPEYGYEENIPDYDPYLAHQRMMEHARMYTPFHDEAARATRLIHGLHRTEAAEWDDLNRPPPEWSSEFFPLDERYYLGLFGLVVYAIDGLPYVLVADPDMAREVQEHPMPGTMEGSEVVTQEGSVSVLMSVSRIPELEEEEEEREAEEESQRERSEFGSEASTASSRDYTSESAEEEEEERKTGLTLHEPTPSATFEEEEEEVPERMPRSRSVPTLPPRSGGSARYTAMYSESQFRPPAAEGAAKKRVLQGTFVADLGVMDEYKNITPAGRRRFRWKKYARQPHRAGRSRHTKGGKQKRMELKRLRSERRRKEREIKKERERLKREAREARELKKREQQIGREEQRLQKLDAKLQELREKTGDDLGSAFDKDAMINISHGLDAETMGQVRDYVTNAGAPFPKNLESTPVAVRFVARGEVSDSAPKDDVTRGKLFHTRVLKYDQDAHNMAQDHAFELFAHKFGIPTERAVAQDDGSYVLDGAFKIEPYTVNGALEHKVVAIRGFAGTASSNAAVHEGGWRLTITSPKGAVLGGTFGESGKKRVNVGATMRTGKWHIDDSGGYGGQDALQIHFSSSEPLQIDDSADIDSPIVERFDVDYYDPVNPHGPIYVGKAQRVIHIDENPKDPSKGTIHMKTDVLF